MRVVKAYTLGIIVFVTPHMANAQIVCANCTTEYSEILREAARIQQVAQQITTMKSQLMQLENVYGSVAHMPAEALAMLGQQLNIQQFRNPLPTENGVINSIISGAGSMGSLTRLGQQYLDQNHVYDPSQSGGFAAASMGTNAASIAGVQSMADQLYQSAAAHTTALQGLEAQLATAPDEKAIADISARVQLENTYIASQQVQAQAISTWQQAQVRNSDQQRRESRRCYIDAVLQGMDNGVQADASRDTCSKPLSQANPTNGVQLASAGTSGAGLAAGYDQYLGQSVGTGQCVALVQAVDPSVGLTRTWAQGDAVQGNTSLAVGTPIATFDGSGNYANALDGSSHAAIYLGQNEQGIQVEDQWAGQPASVRTIRWSGNNASNSGSAFHVITKAS